MSRLWWCAGLLGGAVVSTIAACATDASPPLGHGDKVFVDHDATSQPGQPSEPPPGDDGGGDAALDSGGYYSFPDGYDPYGTCLKCGCPSTDYCFGGGTGFTSFSGDCNPAGFAIGCQPIPPACAGGGCDCLIGSVAQTLSCYPECVQNTRILYCAHP